MKEKSAVLDMTHGSHGKMIFLFGLPLLFGNILQQLYNFVDTIVVGRGISLEALAAVGSTGCINFLVLGFIIGLAQGVSILCAQYFGAGEYERVRKSITMSFILCFVVGLLITAISFLSTRWILELLNTPANIIDDATAYIRLIFLASLIPTFYNFYSGILRAVGDSKNPLIAMIIAFIVNTVLDILFVIPLHMGVAGAAYATIIAQAVSMIYCWICTKRISFLKLTKEDWKMDWSLFWKSFSLSMPVALMNSVTACGVMIMQNAINSFGSDYVAGYSTGSKIIILLEQISSTFGFAAGSFVGQNLGAGKVERIKKGVFEINWIVIALNAVSFALMVVFGKSLIRLLIGDESTFVIDIASHCVVFLSSCLIFLGILWIYRCSLQSMGDTLWPMVSGFIEFFARLIAIWLLPSRIGFDGVLMAEILAWICAGAMLYTVYRKSIRKQERKKAALQNPQFS